MIGTLLALLAIYFAWMLFGSLLAGVNGLLDQRIVRPTQPRATLQESLDGFFAELWRAATRR